MLSVILLLTFVDKDKKLIIALCQEFTVVTTHCVPITAALRGKNMFVLRYTYKSDPFINTVIQMIGKF